MKKGAKDKRFFNLKKASSDTKLNETVNEAEVMSPPSEDTLSENVKKKKGFDFSKTALSATLLLIHFLFSVTKHKNSSHNHFLNFLLRKCHHC